MASIHRLDYWLFSPASLQTRPFFAEIGATIGHPRTEALQTLTWLSYMITLLVRCAQETCMASFDLVNQGCMNLCGT